MLNNFLFSVGLLFVMQISQGLCMDSFYDFKTQTIDLNHIEVVGGGHKSMSRAGPLFDDDDDDDDSFGQQMIINGFEAENSKFPFLVSIQILEHRYKRFHICGAVLISTNKLLTAAHCLYHWGMSDHYAAVGYNRLSLHGQALIKITEALIHPKYNPDKDGYPNDLAILTLAKHVHTTDRVQVANLTGPGDPNYDYEYCFITGWGATDDNNHYPDEVRYATLMSLWKHDCVKFFKVFQKKRLIRAHHTCAWNWPYANCYGDSGGPLVCRGQVIGITSWATDCRGCFPVVFSRVASFRKWIDQNI